MALVTVEEIQLQLGSSADAGILSALLLAVEEQLSRLTGQTFGDAATGIVEKLDGSGTTKLWLSRPIAAITSVVISTSVYGSDTTLSLDITDDISFISGKRRLIGKGIYFTEGVENVVVTYNTAAYKPEIAKAAVKEVVISLYRQRGSEDARMEQMGTFQHVLKRAFDETMTWQLAVDSLSTSRIG